MRQCECIRGGERQLDLTGSTDREVFRFTWLPSFDPTITVRVERQGDVYLLAAKRLDQEVHRPLDAREWATFEHYVAEAGFWQMPSEAGDIGLDGSYWILEGAGGSRYHYVDRWWVEDYPAYFRACLCLLKLSGLPLDYLEGYVEDFPPECN